MIRPHGRLARLPPLLSGAGAGGLFLAASPRLGSQGSRWRHPSARFCPGRERALGTPPALAPPPGAAGSISETCREGSLLGPETRRASDRGLNFPRPDVKPPAPSTAWRRRCLPSAGGKLRAGKHTLQGTHGAGGQASVGTPQARPEQLSRDHYAMLTACAASDGILGT